MRERQLSEQTLIVLRKHFAVKTEVTDITGKCRIDVIAVCRETQAVFGVEMKHSDKRRGEELGKIIQQCSRYANTLFPNHMGRYVKVPIFLAPPLSYNILVMNEKSIIFEGQEYIKDRHKRTDTHHTINGMLGTFNVGELRNFEYKYAFMFSNKVIWDNRAKLHRSNYEQLIKKINESISI
jgi:hypothetical protein